MVADSARSAAITAWYGQPPREWARRWGAPRVVILRRTGSTNDQARALAEEGAPHGTVVIAEEQTQGRGQHGRRWTAAPGDALLLSMILDPACASEAAILPLRVGLAAARAVEAVAPLDVAIKWPNDLLVRGRKLGGILCEAAARGDRPLHLVAGIGLNLRQRYDDWPPELAGLATSIAAETGETVRPADLAGVVVRHVRGAVEKGGETLHEDELRELERRDPLRGRPVLLDGHHAGTAGGVAPDGALIILDGRGGRRAVRAGTVRLADPRSGP